MPSPESRRPLATPVAPAVAHAFARLNARAWGIACGLVGGFGLLLATWILVFEGGPTIGPHLALLGHYFPGYSVTLGGGLLGFLYGFVAGYLFGYLIGAVYNRLVPPA